jgi:hypothetical protein
MKAVSTVEFQASAIVFSIKTENQTGASGRLFMNFDINKDETTVKSAKSKMLDGCKWKLRRKRYKLEVNGSSPSPMRDPPKTKPNFPSISLFMLKLSIKLEAPGYCGRFSSPLLVSARASRQLRFLQFSRASLACRSKTPFKRKLEASYSGTKKV